ncbi:hypothetical protein ACLESD_31365 [Pyxidicoccus sp. 3LFB2]
MTRVEQLRDLETARQVAALLEAENARLKGEDAQSQLQLTQLKPKRRADGPWASALRDRQIAGSVGDGAVHLEAFGAFGEAFCLWPSTVDADAVPRRTIVLTVIRP